MPRIGQFSQYVGWMLLPALLVAPVLAHTVKVDGDVAATFHIEPHHNPVAGKPSLAWFALTRKGGQLIPLAQCKLSARGLSYPPRRGQNTAVAEASVENSECRSL